MPENEPIFKTVLFINNTRKLCLEVNFFGFSYEKIEQYLKESYIEPPPGKRLKSNLWEEFKYI